MQNIDSQQYASEVIVNLPPPRTSIYIESNYDKLLQGATQWGSQVNYLIGYASVATPMPLLDRLEDVCLILLFVFFSKISIVDTIRVIGFGSHSQCHYYRIVVSLCVIDLLAADDQRRHAHV